MFGSDDEESDEAVPVKPKAKQAAPVKAPVKAQPKKNNLFGASDDDDDSDGGIGKAKAPAKSNLKKENPMANNLP